MHQITGTIITLNAEKHILRAIESLKNVCDEIIVLDSESTDSTREIASSAGAQVFIQPFLGDGGQKKEASKFSTNNWIFSLDADEYLDSDLIDFSLELQNPSMIHEQEKIELMSQQLDIAEKAIDTKLFSKKWIYCARLC